MVRALDSLIVVVPDPAQDEQLEDWLAQLALAAELKPIQDHAPAFSKRPLSLKVSINRPTVSSVQGATWQEIVAGAGGMVDVVERSLGGALTPGAAVWLEATAEQTLAAAFGVHAFGGEQAIGLIVFDLTPGAVLKFLQPLGRQALKRVCASLEGSGVIPYFMARERSAGEALLALDARTILDASSLPRCVPRQGALRDEEIDLTMRAVVSPPTGRLIDPLCQRVLELCDLRTQAPLRVTVKGTTEQIARAAAYLEDLVRSRIVLRLEPAQGQAQGISLNALRASPVLEAAFGSNITAGVDSDSDAMDLRHIRESGRPERWVMDVSRRLADQIGHGLKDIMIGEHEIQLDIRP